MIGGMASIEAKLLNNLEASMAKLIYFAVSKEAQDNKDYLKRCLSCVISDLNKIKDSDSLK